MGLDDGSLIHWESSTAKIRKPIKGMSELANLSLKYIVSGTAIYFVCYQNQGLTLFIYDYLQESLLSSQRLIFTKLNERATINFGPCKHLDIDASNSFLVIADEYGKVGKWDISKQKGIYLIQWDHIAQLNFGHHPNQLILSQQKKSNVYTLSHYEISSARKVKIDFIDSSFQVAHSTLYYVTSKGVIAFDLEKKEREICLPFNTNQFAWVSQVKAQWPHFDL